MMREEWFTEGRRVCQKNPGRLIRQLPYKAAVCPCRADVMAVCYCRADVMIAIMLQALGNSKGIPMGITMSTPTLTLEGNTLQTHGYK